VLDVLFMVLLEPMSVEPVVPLAEPDAPMLVPLPVEPVVPEVSALVVGAVAGVVTDEDSVVVVVVGAGAGTVVELVSVEVDVSRWQADSDRAAIRARAAQRARGVSIIGSLLELVVMEGTAVAALTGTFMQRPS
jgi:hypothetical protein